MTQFDPQYNSAQVPVDEIFWENNVPAIRIAVCDRCGVTVQHPTVHTEWHNNMNNALAAIVSEQRRIVKELNLPPF